MTRARKQRAVDRRTGADDPACESNHGLVELDREACLELLGSIEVGRVAWADGERVIVFPLNFVLEGQYILALTPSEVIFAAAATHQALTFQGDEAESGVHTGWTVLLSGPAEEITAGAEAERVRGLVSPWRRNGPFRVLRIRVDEVTGRRLVLRPGAIKSLYIE